MLVIPTGLPKKTQKTEYFCQNQSDIYDDRESYACNGAWIVYSDDSTNGLKMQYYDGYFNINNFSAGWYCDNCLEYIYDCASEDEENNPFGELSYQDAIKIFDSHLSVELEEFLRQPI